MDEYSYISENGTVRQIRDLVAKAKDEEQDLRLDALEQTGIIDTYSETETATNKRWIDGSVIYRKVIVFSPGIRIEGTQGGNLQEGEQTLVTIGAVASQIKMVTDCKAISGTTRNVPAMIRNWSGTAAYVILLWTSGTITHLILEYTKL